MEEPWRHFNQEARYLKQFLELFESPSGDASKKSRVGDSCYSSVVRLSES